MAKGAGGKGGGKGGKGGKQTARSQNYLRQYGYPSSRELRREAEGTAGASVSSIHEVRQPFKRQAQSAKDFLAAVQSVLSETQGQVGAGYDQATSQQAALDAATQQRLAGLGLGVDSAGVQAASGARGDSATANLLSNAASAKAYAASQPGIAAGNTGVVLAGLRKQETDALATRRDQLRQSFFAALQNAQQNALAHASFNQSADQFAQNMSLQQQQFAFQEQQAATQASQFAQSRSDQRHQFAETMLAKGFDVTTGKFVNTPGTAQTAAGLAKKYGLTPNEVISLQSHTSTQVEGLLAQGYSWKKAVARAEANGVPPEIARMSVYSIYSNPPPPPGAPNPNGYTNGASDPKYKADYAAWHTHVQAYNAALSGWQHYLQSRQGKAFYKALGISLASITAGQSGGEGQLGRASSQGANSGYQNKSGQAQHQGPPKKTTYPGGYSTGH